MRKKINEDFSQARNDAYDICEYLDKYAPTLWYELADYKGSLMNTSKVSFIIDGDWKHDHLYFRDMIEQWANDNGRGIFKIDSREIGHSYDDSYEAQYDIYITKDQDALDELNSMRRLFVGESLKRKGNKIRRRINEGIDIDRDTNIHRAPLYMVKDEIVEFNNKAKAYPYWVIKTEKWYDPEGLNIPDDKKYNIQFAGTREECRDKLKQIEVDCQRLLDWRGRPENIIEDRGRNFITIYYTRAIAKATFMIIKNPFEL